MPNPYAWIRRLPPGSAFLVPLQVKGKLRELSWLIRKRSDTIEEIKASCEISQRGGLSELSTRGKTVVAVYLQIGLGKAPFDEASISEAFLNEHAPAPYGGTLESLTTQNEIPIHLFGDSGEREHSMAVGNVGKRFAVEALARVTQLPAWTPEEFDDCLIEMFNRAPTVMALWNRPA